ncbi:MULTISPECIES: WGR domain-containing protein [unclassified Shinella]|uniref:WGR domain-containing protein n=1 Tax=unclassified Shinella TaxID=2643062 RepID=UPI00225C7686|nr:WGR domain-containing protein [Shinella sp. YE25]MDC7259361.1 WGR domain-containing protein [Shinella sp. YE25]CAI0336153.1 WGR domain-containing protein [Rhizobiaceae bacterium]CAK7261540.1 WGR domain-containing protein [Shinella sp. WSC3-e]
MEETRSSHFERRDAARNMQRFYRLTVTRDLFGTVLLLREWGRIGVFSRERAQEKRSLADAWRDAERLAAQKCRRGYVPVGE